MVARQSTGTPDGSGSMAARRRLGRLLAELREARGVTQEAAAEFIERVPSTLYRMEQGRPGVRIRIKQDIRGLCELYEADEATRNGLMQLAEATKVKGWFQPDKDLLPPNFDMYVGLEQDAAELDIYEPQLVPGLLQTEGYARALVSIPDYQEREADEIERRVRLRLRRQEVLTRPRPARVHTILNEAVLRRPVGGPAVMAEQLRHLNELSELPNVTVRALPFASGVHDGLIAGNFIALRFPDDDAPPMVYADLMLGGLWFEEPKEVARFARAFTDISEKALDEAASRELIDRAAKELTRYA